ncbi:MAG: hypothetical protein PHY05_09805 [Methanothrix sp.]|nr:hypothetical protein [Methanothrix sp.]
MDKKLSISDRLAGSIQLDDQKLIDEIIKSEIWNYDDDNECHNPVDAARLWQSQNPGKGDYSKERSHVCDLGIDEIFQGIKRMKKEKIGGR